MLVDRFFVGGPLSWPVELVERRISCWERFSCFLKSVFLSIRSGWILTTLAPHTLKAFLCHSRKQLNTVSHYKFYQSKDNFQANMNMSRKKSLYLAFRICVTFYVLFTGRRMNMPSRMVNSFDDTNNSYSLPV